MSSVYYLGMALTYLKGDATQQGDGNRIIAHIVNTAGGWGAGFVLAVSRRWAAPERDYRAWHRSGQGFELGAVRLVIVEPGLWVANMLAQEGYGHQDGPPIRYDALRQCLTTVAGHAKELGASVRMPRIGAGLAGGDWRVIEPIIVETMAEVPAFVYDFGK